MRIKDSNIGNSAPGLAAIRLLGTLAVIAIVGCAGSVAPTSPPVPTATPTAAPRLSAAPTERAEPVAGTPVFPTTPVSAEPVSAEPVSSEIEPSPTVALPNAEAAARPTLQAFPLPAGSRPHDVAPALDGGVWYTAQGSGALGSLDPDSGETRHTPLGAGSRPHGVIVGPDGAPWITDGGLNAIVRVDPETLTVETFPLPPERPNANLNTATFDHRGILWFTGQNGVYGRLDPQTGGLEVFDAPRGRGPYGIATSPSGDVYYASLAGSYVGLIDIDTGQTTVLDLPTPNQGARRVWPDSQGRIWVSEWNAGQVAVYDPATGSWREWKLPGRSARAYAVYVDETDAIWLSDFGANSVVRFQPKTEEFEVFPLPSDPSNVRQILGRPGEVWLPESAADQLVLVRF